MTRALALGLLLLPVVSAADPVTYSYDSGAANCAGGGGFVQGERWAVIFLPEPGEYPVTLLSVEVVMVTPLYGGEPGGTQPGILWIWADPADGSLEPEEPELHFVNVDLSAGTDEIDVSGEGIVIDSGGVRVGFEMLYGDADAGGTPIDPCPADDGEGLFGGGELTDERNVVYAFGGAVGGYAWTFWEDIGGGGAGDFGIRLNADAGRAGGDADTDTDTDTDVDADTDTDTGTGTGTGADADADADADAPSDCETADDCEAGQVCRDGVCEQVRCENDDECGAGRACNDGLCDDVCIEDSDCPDQDCSPDGFCVDEPSGRPAGCGCRTARSSGAPMLVFAALLASLALSRRR